MTEQRHEIPSIEQLSNLLDSSNDAFSLHFQHSNRKRIAVASIITMATDAFALSIALCASAGLLQITELAEIDIVKHLTVLPLIVGVFFVIGAWRGFYPGYPIAVVAEFRQIFYANAALFATLAVGTFLFREHFNYSRAAFLLSWIFSVPFVLAGRALLRTFLGNSWFWGAPALVMGCGTTGQHVIESLQKNPQLGIRAIAALDNNPELCGYVRGVPVINNLKHTRKLAKSLGVHHLIVAIPSLPVEILQQISRDYGDVFEHITIISDKFGISSLWVSPGNLGLYIGLDVQHQLLRRSSQIKKRVIDISLSLVFGLIALPIIAIIAVLIRLDSPGPVFYRQQRIGRGNRRFTMIKFRSMYSNSHIQLQQMLDQSDELRAEYEIFHKISNDPRITRIGRFLRKYSIDELPQFWNILKGDMSLIGPRAYGPWEKDDMQGYDDIIFKVVPGLTGLWQVTERNDSLSTFSNRMRTDDYYICNWSMFMDAFIIIRTFAVILLGRGR